MNATSHRGAAGDPPAPPDPTVLRRAQSLCVGPLAGRLAGWGVSPSALTWCGLVLGVACGAAVWAQRWPAAVALWVAASFFDLVDGPVARASGRASARGARLDTACDRVVDAAPLVGFLAGGTHVWAAACALAVVWLPALVGQLGDRRGVAARGGPLGRPQRALVTLVALAAPPVTAVCLWVLAAGSLLTAAWRVGKLAAATRPASLG